MLSHSMDIGRYCSTQVVQLSVYLPFSEITLVLIPEIGGYTNSDSNASANENSSPDRANDIGRKLKAMGIGATSLTTKCLGVSKDIDTNSTIEGKLATAVIRYLPKS